jgi:hypothetical protein
VGVLHRGCSVAADHGRLGDCVVGKGCGGEYPPERQGGRRVPVETDLLRDPDGLGWHIDRPRFGTWLRSVVVARGSTLLAPASLRAVEGRAGGGWQAQLSTPGGDVQVAAAVVIDAAGRTAALRLRGLAARGGSGSIGWSVSARRDATTARPAPERTDPRPTSKPRSTGSGTGPRSETVGCWPSTPTPTSPPPLVCGDQEASWRPHGVTRSDSVRSSRTSGPSRTAHPARSPPTRGSCARVPAPLVRGRRCRPRLRPGVLPRGCSPR